MHKGTRIGLQKNDRFWRFTAGYDVFLRYLAYIDDWLSQPLYTFSNLLFLQNLKLG